MKRLQLTVLVLLTFSFILFAQEKTERASAKLEKQIVSEKPISPTANSKLNGTTAVASWDFTQPGAAYVDPSKGNPPMVVVDNIGGQDVYAMAAGDANSDGNVTTLDLTIWLPDNNTAASGYVNSDMNMDGNVTTLDLTKWLPNNNSAMSTHVPN